MNKESIEKIRKDFEANMLDGDSVDDCGGAVISAKEVLNYVIDALAEREAELWQKMEEMKKHPLYNSEKYPEENHIFQEGQKVALTSVQLLLTNKK